MLCPIILFIHCILLSKEMLLITKVTLQYAKNVLQFFKKDFHLHWTKRLGMFNAKWISKGNLNTVLCIAFVLKTFKNKIKVFKKRLKNYNESNTLSNSISSTRKEYLLLQTEIKFIKDIFIRWRVNQQSPVTMS